MDQTADILIVGGGVIGLSIAYELAGQGSAVIVLEQGQFGREASWAGAGILPPGNPEGAADPAARLRAHSHILWPRLSAELRESTGIDNGYRVSGGLEVLPHGGVASQLTSEIEAWRSEGVAVEELSTAELRECEPALNPSITAAYRLPGMSQVRNPRHLKALVAGCAARGVRLVAGQPVIGFDRREQRIAAVRTPTGTFAAAKFCVAGGAWSRQVLATVGCEIAVEPVRGQIILLSCQPLPFRHIINCGPRYLVPRPDGRILVGSTEEHVGFEKQNTAGAISGLLEFAVDLVPALAKARFEQAWSGLRPGSA
ncbi:MAG TPA: FAD-dependent oxidoreductase, partial [Planctomycetaceae bacterium]|nr:FAD-dependent oxidoreductase [Planctomycetaceae bacterium]